MVYNPFHNMDNEKLKVETVTVTLPDGRVIRGSLIKGSDEAVIKAAAEQQARLLETNLTDPSLRKISETE